MDEQQSQGAAGQSSGASQQSGQGQAPSGGADNMKKDVGGMFSKFEATLDEYMVTKAPFNLPMGLKEFIVKIAPYLIIISAVLALPFILAALGMSALFTPFAMMGGAYSWGGNVILSLLTSVIVLVMEVMAVSGLFKRTRKAWRLVFYATIVSLIGSLLALNIIGGVIGAIIGWYILFQVKALYHN